MKLEFLLAIIPCILMAFIIYKNDKKEKEPIREIVKAFIMGMAAIFLTLFLSSVFGFDVVVVNNSSFGELILYSFVYIALVEELSKFLFSYLFVRKNENFNYLFDGIVYFVCVSLGFALIENLLYAVDGDLYTTLLRGFTAIPAHVFFGITSGYYYVLYMRNKFNNKKGYRVYLLLSILFPILLHGFYDFCILIDHPIFTYIYVMFMVVLYYISINKIEKLKEKDDLIKKKNN